MKKSQLNAISAAYTRKRNAEALKTIIARGLLDECLKSKKSPAQFLRQYRTPEQIAAAKAAAKARAADRRAMLKANFPDWWAKQLASPAASIRIRDKIKKIRAAFEVMEYGRIEYLAAFLKQDKWTREVSIDFDKVKYISKK